jgi:hypothetical protein
MKSFKIKKPQKKHLISLALLVVINSYSCEKISSAPEGLIGVWKATDIRYDNTSFEIKRKTLTFHTREGDINSFAIIEIKKEQMEDNEWLQYTIYYRNRDLQKVEFPFYFRLSDKSAIRFVNQPYLVWKKEGSIKP